MEHGPRHEDEILRSGEVDPDDTPFEEPEGEEIQGSPDHEGPGDDDDRT